MCKQDTNLKSEHRHAARLPCNGIAACSHPAREQHGARACVYNRAKGRRMGGRRDQCRMQRHVNVVHPAMLVRVVRSERHMAERITAARRTDLARAIAPAPEHIEIDFLKASSYGRGRTETTGKVKINEGFDMANVAGECLMPSRTLTCDMHPYHSPWREPRISGTYLLIFFWQGHRFRRSAGQGHLWHQGVWMSHLLIKP